MYNSPIEIFMQDVADKIVEQQDNVITMEISRQYGVNIDAEELKKALAYDRKQYEIGYADGARAEHAAAERGAHWVLSKDGATIKCSEPACGFSTDAGNAFFAYCPMCGRVMTTLIPEWADGLFKEAEE